MIFTLPVAFEIRGAPNTPILKPETMGGTLVREFFLRKHGSSVFLCAPHNDAAPGPLFHNIPFGHLSPFCREIPAKSNFPLGLLACREIDSRQRCVDEEYFEVINRLRCEN